MRLLELPILQGSGTVKCTFDIDKIAVIVPNAQVESKASIIFEGDIKIIVDHTYEETVNKVKDVIRDSGRLSRS